MHDLDQFYTRPDVALQCITHCRDIVNFDEYDVLLEPSAGEGAFYSLLDPDRRVGIDIDPKHPEVLARDFLLWSPRLGKKMLVIGNPPFGVQSAVALKFFKHAAEFANTIAFVVPISWTKWSHHRRLPTSFRLISSLPLPKNAFIFQGKEYDVPCVFQIWTREDSICPAIDHRITARPVTTHEDFEFLPKSRTADADFLLVVCGARRILVHETTSSLSPFTVERIKSNAPGVRTVFEEIDWSKYFNRTNTGTMWINRETIVREYTNWLAR